jgi:multidrug transporter EmrE-like cation transporter
MAISSGLCFFFAILAAFLNGSFIVPFKIPSVAKYNVEPLVFLQYNCFGIFVSSWLCNAFLPLNGQYVDNAGTSFQFVWLAFLGGVIFAGSISCSFIAVETIGLALSQGIFGGAAIVTSYLWATIVFEEYPTNVPLSVFGILILIVGVFGIAQSQTIADKIWGDSSNAASKATSDIELQNEAKDNKDNKAINAGNPNSSSSAAPTNTTEGGEGGEEDGRGSIFSARNTLVPPRLSREKFIYGLTFALLCGILGGTGLVPLHYVSDSQQGLVFLPALGTGSLFAAPLILLFSYYRTPVETRKWPSFYLKDVGPYGTLSGMIWNTNNIVAVAAIPVLGYGVVFPIIQCAIFVAGMWGIFVFKEMTGDPVKVFFASGLVLIVGAIMQSLAG